MLDAAGKSLRLEISANHQSARILGTYIPKRKEHFSAIKIVVSGGDS
jgi:hypothetical protein